MHRLTRFHYGIDVTGHRCVRMKSVSEVRRCCQQKRLFPRIVWAASGAGQGVWRNGLHKRNWLAVCAEIRGDRRCFLTTLDRPPLVPPFPTAF